MSLSTQDELIEKWTPLVIRIAVHYTTQRPVKDTEEYADGLIGLWRAIQRFDSAQGVTFIIYAFSSIKWEIIEGYRRRKSQYPSATSGVKLTKLPEYTDPPTYSQSFQFEVQDELRHFMSLIPPQTMTVLKYSLGGLNSSQIASELNLSEPRICQLRAQGLRQLQSIYKKCIE